MTSFGYIKLFRKLLESSFYKNVNTCHLAVHLILKANHKNNKIVFNGKEITMQAGELITGRKALAYETGLSERSVRTSLHLLSTIGFLTKKTTNRFSIISIVKYQDYQENDQQIDQQTTSKRPANDQQTTTDNNDKNDKNGKKTPTEPPANKVKHLDFVYLTPQQHEALEKMFGIKGAQGWIERVNTYAHKIGERKFKARYSSHYHVIREWYDRDVKEGKTQEIVHSPEKQNELDETVNKLLREKYK